MARQRQNKRKTYSQPDLTTTNLLPLLKKPMELIGRKIKVPGTYWAENAAPAEIDKNFVCVCVDFELIHRFNRDKADELKSNAVKLTEMGESGEGGNSDDFWMRYPHPFLEYYYKTFPSELPGNNKEGVAETAVSNVLNVSNDVMDVSVVDDAMTDEVKNAKVYANLLLIRSTKVTQGKQRGRVRHNFSCNLIVDDPKSNRDGCVCQSPITIWGKSTGPFFKHVRAKAAAGCKSHKKLLSCRRHTTFLYCSRRYRCFWSPCVALRRRFCCCRSNGALLYCS